MFEEKNKKVEKMKRRDKHEMVQFCQELIRTPSPSGQEGELAKLIKKEMEELGYDEVRTDEAGNLIGKINGRDKSAPSLAFTAHMDQVAVNSPESWNYKPFGGEIDDGFVHGRGASDTKGAIATQVYVPKILDRVEGHHGDVYVALSVLEETGGLGTNHLLKNFRADYAVMGEGTGNEIRIGNRGRVLVRLSFQGNSMHSSSAGPDDIIHYDVAELLLKIRDISMKKGKLGSSSVAPTIYDCDNQGSNITPSSCEVLLDWRTVETENSEDVMERISELIPENCQVHLDPLEQKTYTGTTLKSSHRQTSFYIDPADPFVEKVTSGLERQYNRDIPVTTWDFTTDCGMFIEAGTKIIGFSPCEEKFAHTSRDRVSIDLMEEAMEGYSRIIETVSDL